MGRVVRLDVLVGGLGSLVGGCCGGVWLGCGRRIDRELVCQRTFGDKRLRRFPALGQRQERRRVILHERTVSLQKPPTCTPTGAGQVAAAHASPLSTPPRKTHLDLAEKVNPTMPLERMQHRPPLRKRQRRGRRPYEDRSRRKDAEWCARCVSRGHMRHGCRCVSLFGWPRIVGGFAVRGGCSDFGESWGFIARVGLANGRQRVLDPLVRRDRGIASSRDSSLEHPPRWPPTVTDDACIRT